MSASGGGGDFGLMAAIIFLAIALGYVDVEANKKITSLRSQVDVLEHRAEAAEKETAKITDRVIELGNWTVWVNASIYECGCAHKDQP